MDDITDGSDFVSTRAPFLVDLDSTLRCHICKELFNAPVITTCGHTFCSLCIRHQLVSEKRCPDCRAEVQVSSLRKNPAVEEIVEAWVPHRAKLLDILTTPQPREADTMKNEANEESSQDRDAAEGLRRSSRKRGIPNYDEFSQPGSQPEEKSIPPGCGQCPICGQVMKIKEIEQSHIMQCLGEGKKTQVPLVGILSKRGGASMFSTSKASGVDMTRKLASVNYHLLSDSKLRSALAEFGLSSKGVRKTLETRHREWLNLWNSNADSKTPVDKSTLVGRLNSWEKTMAAAERAPTLSIKEVDADQWAVKHASDFDDLIAQARLNAKKRRTGEAS